MDLAFQKRKVYLIHGFSEGPWSQVVFNLYCSDGGIVGVAEFLTLGYFLLLSFLAGGHSF
jgi:hypothetical protein